MNRNYVFLSAVISLGFIASASHAQSNVVGWGLVPSVSPPSIERISQVACGGFHTIILRTDGGVACFGYDLDGQCDVPPSALGGVTQVAAGFSFSMALKNTGGVLAWGNNSSGQCDVPTSAGSGVARIASNAVGAFALAQKQDGSLVGWGDSGYGVTTIPASAQGATQFACGNNHALAVTPDGHVVAWGQNDDYWGQALGSDANGNPITCEGSAATGQQVQVLGQALTNVAQVAGGMSFSLALLNDGHVVGWGSPNAGAAFVPADLAGVSGLATTANSCLALKSDGHVVEWATNGPIEVPSNVRNVTQLAAGYAHRIGLVEGGAAIGWGDNFVGQCNTPPSTLAPCTAITSGQTHALALMPGGEVIGWGSSGSGEINIPAAARQGVTAIAAGRRFSVAVRDGGVLLWGENWGDMNVPASAQSGITTVAASIGSPRCLALKDDGVIAWGANWGGQCLGTDANGEPVIELDPDFGFPLPATGQFVQIMGQQLQGITQIACGDSHSLAVTNGGAVRTWGDSLGGILDVPVAAQSGVSRVAGGMGFTVAVKVDGSMLAWGVNESGECNIPPSAQTGAVDVACGSGHSIALLADGSIAAWGQDYNGQCAVSPGRYAHVAAGANSTYAMLLQNADPCDGLGAPITVSPRVNTSYWRYASAWQWFDGGERVPGSESIVDLGDYGSVASDCAAKAGTFAMHPGSKLYVPVECTEQGCPGLGAPVLDVTTECMLGGTLQLTVSGTGTALPPDMAPIPVLSAGSVDAAGQSFDILTTNLPAPAGKFLTVVPSDVNGRTVFSLQLLDLPGNAELTGASTGSFSGAAVAAATIDINHDGFDDLALAIDFGAGQPGLIQILLNDGMGNLGGTSVLESTPAQPTCMAAGDVDGDGNKDLVVGLASDGTVRAYLDNGLSSLTAGDVINVNDGTPTAVMVLANSGSNFALGSSTVVTTSNSKLKIYGTTTLQQEFTVAGTPSTVSGGDTKGTGGTTVVTGGTTSATFGLLPSAETGFVQTLVRGANGQYAINQTFGLTAKPAAVDVADIDGDGLADIVTANADPVAPAPGSALPVLSIFRNSGGSFNGGTPYQPEGASSARSVALIDVDNDGDRDIVSVNNQAGTTKATLLRIDTLGAGTPLSVGQTTVLPASNPIIATRGNLDGVGGEDLFLVTQSGAGQLTGSNEVKPFLGVAGLQGDLDGDGSVGPSDISILLLDFGPCPGTPCPSDLDGDGEVTSGDIAFLLLLFG
jgi:alpha-tubulin suppressor-like RCC1 family protein